MDDAIKDDVERLLNTTIKDVRPVSGGDISMAFLLETGTQHLFCKLNPADNAHNMFMAEKKGLEAIVKTKSIAAPKVVLCEAIEKSAILILEYIEPKTASSEEMRRFGRQLAAMHTKAFGDNFGWEHGNFIGNLPQSNINYTDWSEFYVAERLLPQLKLAKNEGRLRSNEIPSEGQMLKTCRNLFPEVRPSLLHGDLWSGNYLISQNGTPYLIDPATYYGHHEVDIAMTRLFGGFGQSFYDGYYADVSKVGGEAERNDIYQLYYLLVHLNLFGASYKAPVTDILNRYF